MIFIYFLPYVSSSYHYHNYYLIHQTIIILVAFGLRGLGLPLWIDTIILMAATVAGCGAFYLIGREVRWLRPLIGLRPKSADRPSVLRDGRKATI